MAVLATREQRLHRRRALGVAVGEILRDEQLLERARLAGVLLEQLAELRPLRLAELLDVRVLVEEPQEIQFLRMLMEQHSQQVSLLHSL